MVHWINYSGALFDVLDVGGSSIKHWMQAMLRLTLLIQNVIVLPIQVYWQGVLWIALHSHSKFLKSVVCASAFKDLY